MKLCSSPIQRCRLRPKVSNIKPALQHKACTQPRWVWRAKKVCNVLNASSSVWYVYCVSYIADVAFRVREKFIPLCIVYSIIALAWCFFYLRGDGLFDNDTILKPSINYIGKVVHLLLSCLTVILLSCLIVIWPGMKRYSKYCFACLAFHVDFCKMLHVNRTST